MKNIESIISDLEKKRAAIDHALEALRQIGGAAEPAGKRRGRPPGTKSEAAPAKKAVAKKRNLSPEGKKRIAEAAKRRWAELRAAKTSS